MSRPTSDGIELYKSVGANPVREALTAPLLLLRLDLRLDRCSVLHTARLTLRAVFPQVINGIGSVTFLGGSTPDPRVEAAMEAANGSFVPMDDLQKKVGVAIGDMIDNVNGAGAYPTRALVTSGCAGAMTLASAAAMAGTDPAKIIQLPDTAGMPCEVLIQSNQRYHYDRAWEFAGAKLVEYEPTVEALQAAINHRTVACVSRPPKFFPGSLPISTIAEIAHAKGVYLMVDAAGETFPLEDLTRYIKEGADVQCVATKYIGASQSTGIALGSEEFIHKMFLQTFVGFETANDGHDTGWATPKDFGAGKS